MRTLISALSILVGALLVAAWAVSQFVVGAVEDGTAAQRITAGVLSSPVALSQISVELGDAAVSKLDTGLVDVEALGLDEPIRNAITGVVNSEAFSTAVQTQVALGHDQLENELTDDDRDPAPLVLNIDVSSLINDGIDEVPAVGAVAPDVSLSPVPVQLVSADDFEDARTTYRLMQFAAAWFLWAGIALMVLGMLISSRKRWFPAKALLAVGVFSLGLWALLTWTEPETIAGWLPGGEGGSVGTIIVSAFTEESAGAIAGRMMWWGVISLVAAALFALVAVGMKGRTGSSRATR